MQYTIKPYSSNLVKHIFVMFFRYVRIDVDTNYRYTTYPNKKHKKFKRYFQDVLVMETLNKIEDYENKVDDVLIIFHTTKIVNDMN